MDFLPANGTFFCRYWSSSVWVLFTLLFLWAKIQQPFLFKSPNSWYWCSLFRAFCCTGSYLCRYKIDVYPAAEISDDTYAIPFAGKTLFHISNCSVHCLLLILPLWNSNSAWVESLYLCFISCSLFARVTYRYQVCIWILTCSFHLQHCVDSSVKCWFQLFRLNLQKSHILSH